MKFLRKISTIALAIMLCSSLANAAEPIAVKLDSVNSSYVEYVNFEKTAPVVVDNKAMVPVRDFAIASGMEVDWDQSTLTALVSIDVTQDSQSPIIVYGKEVMSKVSNYGLDLKPKKITAALQADNQNGIIRYVFTDSEGDEVCIGKAVDLGNAPKFVEGHVLMTPLRATALLIGLDVQWSQRDLAVEVSIPDVVVAPMDVKIIPQHTPVEIPEPTPEPVQVPIPEPTPMPTLKPIPAATPTPTPAPTQNSKGKYLGRFKITHYCACSKCCGKWGGVTAYAGALAPGRSIAVDPKVIPKLSWVYIDGYGLRRAEDCGGAIKGNRIDIAVSSHAEALRLGVVYKDVYLQQ